MADAVNHPAHYAGAHGVECAEAIRNVLDRDAGLSGDACYWYGCALKYLWRWPLKGGREDLEKCKRCIDYLLADDGAAHDGL